MRTLPADGPDMRTCTKCGGSRIVDYDTECVHDHGEAQSAVKAQLGAAMDRAGPAYGNIITALWAMEAWVAGDIGAFDEGVATLEARAIERAERKAHPLVAVQSDPAHLGSWEMTGVPAPAGEWASGRVASELRYYAGPNGSKAVWEEQSDVRGAAEPSPPDETESGRTHGLTTSNTPERCPGCGLAGWLGRYPHEETMCDDCAKAAGVYEPESPARLATLRRAWEATLAAEYPACELCGGASHYAYSDVYCHASKRSIPVYICARCYDKPIPLGGNKRSAEPSPPEPGEEWPMGACVDCGARTAWQYSGGPGVRTVWRCDECCGVRA